MKKIFIYVKSTKSRQENAHYGRIHRRDVEYRNMQNISEILVDADACPVKDEIVRRGAKFYVEILFIASYVYCSRKQQGNWVYVDSEQDEVDFLYL